MAAEVIAELQAGRPARGVPVPEEAPNAARDLGSLTSKPVLFVANVDEGSEVVPAAVAAARGGARRGRGGGVLADRGRARGARGRGCGGDARGARHQRVRPAARRARGVRAARTDRLLHRRRGASRRSRGTCATGSRRGTRPGEIHTDIQKGFVRAEVIGWRELVDAGGYAGRARSRHPAPRGSRLRDGRRRRDHRQVHAVASSLQALGEPPHRRARGSCQFGGAARRSPSPDPAAGSTVDPLQGRDLLERPQQLGVLAQRRRGARAHPAPLALLRGARARPPASRARRAARRRSWRRSPVRRGARRRGRRAGR